MTLEEIYYVSQIVAVLPGTADILSALPLPKIKSGLQARAPRSCP